ncbi:N-acetylglucosamine-6-sulfatase-like isoform X2 [Amphibalanus amphitrite]|uniref:N-acetylglucosamine-6-sulfatase-like isoform X2 n=1 Tax=Amphibalanus amphitrite TaxID=1232801 RepID=UPI001C908FAA|nr:N-acetylglucosamine-6-sulfatase-like isoform X2 [Amphibalanus amphitrite]
MHLDVTIFQLNLFYLENNLRQIPSKSKHPSFVFILTDDQDTVLQGMHPMSFTKKFFQDGGVEFKNAFVSTPVCCPSRATLLTGRYQHNTAVRNNTLAGNCCGSDWRGRSEPRTVAALLRQRGYNTFYAGKYLNQYGEPSAGGVSHVPPGWDWWVGLVGNSRYYNYTLSVNGTARRHGDRYEEDYLTDVITRYALEFLRGRSAGGAPFFLMVAPPAPHSPQTPAPQYARLFPGARAPRTASFNIAAEDKHRLLREPPSPLPEPVLQTLDGVFRDRWRTLLSVDDMVAALTERMAQMGLLDDTYLIYTSDHGYHLGQFSLTVDKRMPYEFDLRVPLYVRGGRLPAGRAVRAPVSAVDLAPTVLQLAGMDPDPRWTASH